MKQRARQRLWFAVLALVAATSYPAFVLGYTWTHVANAGLPGGRFGPLDAYRHTLASAVVAFTVGPEAVSVVSSLMEGKGRPADLMDVHNNRIGSAIGSDAKTFAAIEPAVRAQVQLGEANANDAARVTWLSPSQWKRGWLR